jgi:hypothetical protein
MDLCLYTHAFGTVDQAKMMNRTATLMAVFILIVVALGAIFIFYSELQSEITSKTYENASSCPNNQYGTGENSSGSFSCSQVGFNQLNNFPSACSSNEYVTAITTTLSCSPIAQDYRIGLVGYWPFDSNNTDTTTLDVSGYGNTGILENKPVFENGYIDNALNFTHSKSQYVLISNPSSIPLGSNARSFFAWVYVNGSCFSHYAVSSYGQALTNKESALLINSGCDIFFEGYNNDATSTLAIIDNAWNFVGYSYVANSLKMTIFLGDTEQNVSLSGNTKLNTVSSNFCIGGDCPNSAFYANGLIDEARMYNFAFSAQQEANLYQYYENILNGV